MEVKGIIWKKRYNLKGSSVILFMAIFLLSTVPMVPVAHADPCDGLVLWNKLGSLDEVQNSEVGANFVVEGNVGFTDGVFENGFFSTGHWYLGNRIIIPENGLQLDPQRGTIEAWVMYPQDPIVWAYHYGMFGFLDGPYQSGPGRDNTLGQQVTNFIGDGVTGDLYTYYVNVNFGNTVSVEIPNIDQVFQPEDFHHVAIVWEKDGIDSSSNRIRVYIDNVLMGSSDDNNWGTDPDVGNRHTVAKGAGFDDGTPAFVIDNLIIWNYAKTDFSDRFTESPFNEWIDEDSELELVGEVPPTAGISIWHIEGMEVLDSSSDELFFTSKNQGAGCGGGTPASVWKMTLDPNTGDMISIEHIQSLSRIQCTRGDLFESSDGTLFTGGGWCGYKPAYYSTDSGETWQTADSGSVHPPNSVFTFVEFNGDVYAGTGYAPYHGQVYRWLGDGNWELVLDIGIVRNIVDTMVVYDDQLFVGSYCYVYSVAACESTIPVLVSSDGNTFDPTAGIPGCCDVQNLFVVDNQLLARVHDRNSGQEYIYRWNDISETWEEVAAYNLERSSPYAMASHNGVIYTCGQAPGDASAGIYQSVDLGVTWQQIAVLDNPHAYVMTIHDDTLYIGTWNDVNNKAYIYRKSLFSEMMITSCDNDGKEKNHFNPSESVYVKGNGLEANTTYIILIQDDPVNEGDKLSADEDPSGPVLWNKLGSDSEVLNSEVGPDGTIVGSPYTYEPAKYGNGYVRKAGGENCVQFPGSVLHTLNHRGTIELWVNPKVSHPVPYQYGFFALVGQPVSGPTVPENRGNMYLYWGDGVTGTGLYGGVRFDDSLAETPSEPTQFVATVGVPFHAAICWDINGIDSTDEKVRVYRDGVVVGSTTTPWNPGGTDLEDNFKLGMNPDAQGFDKFISDNIIVWNYAKTNFSDRFNETPSTFECVTTDADGSFDPIEIWAIPSDANPNADAFDIVADKLDDDPNTGKYNAASDSIDSATTVGFVALVPELPTLILFSIGLLVLVGYVSRKRF